MSVQSVAAHCCCAEILKFTCVQASSVELQTRLGGSRLAGGKSCLALLSVFVIGSQRGCPSLCSIAVRRCAKLPPASNRLFHNSVPEFSRANAASCTQLWILVSSMMHFYEYASPDLVFAELWPECCIHDLLSLILQCVTLCP